jgi:hypothetical protein
VQGCLSVSNVDSGEPTMIAAVNISHGKVICKINFRQWLTSKIILKAKRVEWAENDYVSSLVPVRQH